MSSIPPTKRRLTESEPAPRRSARIHGLGLASSQSTLALPALRTRGGKRREEEFVPPSHEDKFSKLHADLIPGLINDIVLAKISTVLPVETLQILSCVGPAWRQAMADRLVYDTRLLADSRDNCVVISDTKSSDIQEEYFTPAIYLYSLRSNTCHQLPPIAQFGSGFPYDCECIALDGRVYVLGGRKKSSEKSQQLSSKDVYVLDLAAQGQWKLCARMQAARANFKCGAKDGKIYAFGGTCGREWVRGSEVYDPSVNSWSALTPLRSWASGNGRKVDRLALDKLRSSSFHSSVATGGEELVVVSEEQNGIVSLYHLMAYHPVEDKWRTLSHNFPMFIDGPTAVEIMAEGKLHSISLDYIRVYDIEQNNWTTRYSCSFGSARRQLLWPISALAVGNEIVAIIERDNGLDRCFVRSIGFGSVVNEIVWEQLPDSFPVGDENPSMCFLKL